MLVEIQPFSPSDEELESTVRELRITNPTLGISKFLQLLKSQNPSWLVSEKRLRKVLAFIPTSDIPGTDVAVPNEDGLFIKEKDLVASTGIDKSIDVASLAPKVKIKMFPGGKGKGLVAKDEILMGEVIWQEEPWIVSADPTLYEYFTDQQMCSQCFTYFPHPKPALSLPCPSCNTAYFCNRLCLTKAATSGAHYPLLCPGRNPEAKNLLAQISRLNWRALDVVAKIIAMWRIARETGGKDCEAVKMIEKRIWVGMAKICMERREMERKEWEIIGDMQRQRWKTGHDTIKSLLNPEPTDQNYSSFKSILTRIRPKRLKPEPLTDEERHRWFSYDSFLELLGLVNLNQEGSGGIYALHSHLNHNCYPNVMVRNLPKTYQIPPLSSLPCHPPPPNPRDTRGSNKLTLLARRNINPGEELCVSYVNPRMHVTSRRGALREGYGFWCKCARCLREIKAGDESKTEVEETITGWEEELFELREKQLNKGGDGVACDGSCLQSLGETVNEGVASEPPAYQEIESGTHRSDDQGVTEDRGDNSVQVGEKEDKVNSREGIVDSLTNQVKGLGINLPTPA